MPAVREADGTTEHYRAGDRVDPSDTVLYEDRERDYCLRVTTDGQYRAGCRRFTRDEALEHWGEVSFRHQTAYVAAILAYQPG